jgi:hypothetical protein
MRPNVISGQAIGTVIAVPNSTDLAGLPTMGLAVGTRVYNIDVSAYFVLTQSRAALVPDQVVAVLNIDGLRWIKEVPSAVDVGAQYPIHSSGGANPVITKAQWQNPVVRYVSGTGDDANTGTAWDETKATWYAAALDIVAAGGGTIFMGPGWRAGGPVPGQGMWLNGTAMSIPGFINGAANCKIKTIGVGGAVDNNQFSRQQVFGYGGSNLLADYRTKPGIWMVGSQVQWTFENLGLLPTPGFAGTYNEGLFCPIRMAVDYNRNADGSIRYLTATSTTRAAGQLTCTVTMPPGIPTTTANHHPDGSATIYLPRPAGMAFPPWQNGSYVWLQSTDPNFPSGAYAVSGLQSNVDDQSQWGFDYSDGNLVTATLSGTITVSCTGANNYIEVQTTDYRIPPTQYQIATASVPTSATTATVVVTDPWGGFPGIGAGAIPATLPPGDYGVQLACLETGFVCNVRPYMDNTFTPHMSKNTAAVDLYLSGPGYQLGGSRAFYPEFERPFLEALYPAPGDTFPYDRLRMGAMVMLHPGVAGGGGVRIADPTGSNVSIVGVFGEFTSLVQVTGGTFDTYNGYLPAAFDLDGGTYSVADINNLFVATESGTIQPDVFRGYYPLNLRGNYGYGASLGTVRAVSDVALFKASQSIAKSPWAAKGGPALGGWLGAQGGGLSPKLVGAHPASWRNISPATARFQNLVLPPASWSATPTTGIADPMGGTGAVRFDDTMHGSATGADVAARTDSFFAAGGHFVMCGWINVESGATNGQGLFQFACGGDLVWEPVSGTGRQSDFLYFQEFGGAGWMFWYYAPKLLSGSATQTYTLTLKSTTAGSGKHMDYFGISAFWCPPTLDDNDVMEFIGTLRAQPYYLQPGMAGTFEGQKFIAHGGLGSAKHYVSGVSSGQITVGSANGKYMELFDESGASLGVVPLSSFTVNP